MVRVHIFCEGQTEETFVREVLQHYLSRLGIYPNPIIFRTSASAKGGVRNYAKLRWQIEQKCKEDQSAFITSLIDLYALPSDFPKKNSFDAQTDPYKKVVMAEEAFTIDINQKNFIPNLMLHEYEALLFSDVSKFRNWFANDAVDKLASNIDGMATPEHVNDNPATAPSKRILRYCSEYDKPVHGSLIAIDIGLDKIRSVCEHFSAWVTKLENLENY